MKKETLDAETKADLEFWRQKTGRESLEAMQKLQKEFWGIDAMSQPICRVARVVELDEVQDS